MGFMDSIRNALGGGSKKAPDQVKGPSTLLKEAGVNTGNLKVKIDGSGAVTILGYVGSQAEMDKIGPALQGVPGINSVDNQATVGAPPAPEPEPVPEPEPIPAPAPEPPVASAPDLGPDVSEPAAEADDAGDDDQTYTVQSGDSLWKISDKFYGNGAHYMDIFEANKNILDDPDKIFPGQELVIPKRD